MSYYSNRSPNLVAVLGDSLEASLYLDTKNRNLSARSQVAWANALYGSNFRFVPTNNGNFGVSGERTDQIDDRVRSVIKSGAGTVIISAGTNDVGQLYPTPESCASVAFINIYNMVNTLVAAGLQVVLELPVGSNAYTAQQVSILNALNQRLIEFAVGTPNVYLHDASRMVLNAAASTTAITPKTNYYYDQTHPQSLGAYYWGKSLGYLLSRIIPPSPRFGHLNAVDVTPSPYLSNGLFVTQSGGLNNAGAGLTSGAVAGSWGLGRSGSATVGIAYGPDNGSSLDPSIGNKAILTITFTAAGERVWLNQEVPLALWNPGDIFDFGCRMRLVSGMSAVASTRMFVPVQLDNVQLNYYSLIEGTSAEYGPDESYTVDHVIGPVTVQDGKTKNWITPRAEVVSRGAGTAVVEVSRFAARKRFAA